MQLTFIFFFFDNIFFVEFKLINSTHYDYLGDMLNAILFDLRTKQSLYGMDGQQTR